MCWATNVKAVCEIAEEDIRIFKVCSSSYINPEVLISPYWGFKYELNKVYSTEEELEFMVCFSDNVYCEIHEGFHSYASDCTILKHTVISIWNNNIFLDSYNTDDVIVYGYIPKGAHYYLNERREYVSDKICLTEMKTI